MPFYKEVSITLAVLAAITFGVALADLIYTRVVICSNTTACSPTTVAVILAYVGSGLWGSIFSFVAAIYGLRYVGDPYGTRQIFLTLLFLATILFIPAIVVINAAAIFMVLNETPGATTSTSLYNFSTPSDGYIVKFILPLIVAFLGLVQFFLAAGMLIYACAKSLEDDDDDDDLMEVEGKGLSPAVVTPVVPRSASNTPGFGYYYPSRIYEIPARSPGFPAGVGQPAQVQQLARYM